MEHIIYKRGKGILMDRMKKQNSYLIYTLLFIIIFPVIFHPFYVSKKSLIWNSDGIRQHYIALMYFGNWGREILNNIFVKHQFSIPLWDFHIGYGSDIITTMHYYVLGDPLNLSSIFVPQKYTEYLYQALIILRFYLSGISFIFYCRQIKKQGIAVLGAALNYTFCGYMLYAGIRHPFFINPMIYLPLLLAGVERIFCGKKATLFLYMVFLSAISNFYFFYMIAFAVCFYVIIRFFTFPHKNTAKELITMIFRFAVYAGIGLCMSAIILLPVLIQFFSTKRLNTTQIFPIFYNAGYYKNLLFSFLKIKHVGEWTILGFTAPALLGILFLFFSKKKYRPIKIALCILTGLLCFPVCGKILNGFSYVSNRWCFIYAGLVSCILAIVWDDMAAFAAGFLKLKKSTKIKSVISVFLLGITLLHICINAFDFYGEKGKNYASEFADSGTAFEAIQISAPKALQWCSGEKTSFYRFETDDFRHMNASAVIGGHSIEYYWSLENSVVPEYYTDMSLRSFHVFNYKDADHRTFLDALASVKYFARTKTNSIPFGYEYKNTISLSENNHYKIYKNKYALPLGYTYHSFIPTELYNEMDSISRQEALMQGIVIDPDNEPEIKEKFPETDLKFTAKSMDYLANYGQHIIIQPDGSLKTTEKKEHIKLTFQGLKNCETYLYFEDVKIDPDQPSDNDLKIGVRSNDTKNKMQYLTSSHKYYKNQKNYLVNLGYHEAAQTKITITLPVKGIYQFGSIKIICQPMEQYITQIANLTENTLENEKFRTNTVTGTLHLSENKILCLSIPYSKGWNAWVDGKKTKLYRANGMFIGLALDSGTHKIKICYQTPGLIPGCWLSIFGWIVFFRYAKKKRRMNLVAINDIMC